MTKTKDVCVILRGHLVARPGEPRCLRPSLSAFVYLPRPLHPFAVRSTLPLLLAAGSGRPAVVITCASVALAWEEKKGPREWPKATPRFGDGKSPGTHCLV